MKRRHFLKNAAATVATLLTTSVGMGWFSRKAKGEALPLRPPGALREKDFLARCIRCHRCIDACPNHTLLPLDASFGLSRQSTPAMTARRQACMLCNGIAGDYLKCTEVCPTGALQRIRKDPDEIREKVAIGKAEIDFALCYSYNNWSCGACYRACPYPDQALHLGLWEKPSIDRDYCIGCGLCERACIRYPQAVRVRPVVS